ncbi:diguanylate cyclase domain-containing protein [Aliarcobacter lanthieri]|uniref:diguanylate cyclase domain-containing protein n=1 Tax=Aliarcobacter lanthieri TaxID=1355374 RepID=UPI003AFADBA8
MKLKNKIKYFLDPLFIVLFLFIITIGSFIFNQNDIDTKVKQYNHSINLIYRIQMLHNEVEAFIRNSASFMNYDEIVTKIELNNQLIEELKNEELYTNFKNIIDDIDRQWKLKIERIERYKSTNSLIISLSSYIIELSKKIKSNYMQNNIEDILLLDKSLINIFTIFINKDNFNNIMVDESLKKIYNLYIKYDNKDFEFLYKRLDLLVKSFSLLNSLRLEIKSFSLEENINLVTNKLYIMKDLDMKEQQNLAIVLFLLSILILIILFVVYNNFLKIRKELKSFKYAVENSDNLIVITNENKEITYVNEAFEKITGYTKDEVLGKNPNILKSGKMSAEYYKNINNTINSGKKWTGEFININKFKEVYYETASITPIKNDGEIIGFLAIKLDVTDYIKEKEKARFLAYHDSLTHLPNRRYLEIKMDEFIKSSRRENKKFAILFLDLDGFKIVNDSLGHDYGDILLKEVANRFKLLLRDTDYVFRVAGDEFVMIINYKNDNDIDIVSRKIIDAINLEFKIKEKIVNIGCSVGISKFPDDANNLDDLLRCSDLAMYQAKEQGKNRFIFYSKES